VTPCGWNPTVGSLAASVPVVGTSEVEETGR